MKKIIIALILLISFCFFLFLFFNKSSDSISYVYDYSFRFWEPFLCRHNVALAEYKLSFDNNDNNSYEKQVFKKKLQKMFDGWDIPDDGIENKYLNQVITFDLDDDGVDEIIAINKSQYLWGLRNHELFVLKKSGDDYYIIGKVGILMIHTGLKILKHKTNNFHDIELVGDGDLIGNRFIKMIGK